MSVESLCRLFGKTRQAYYRYWEREKWRNRREALIVKEVRRFRQEQPRSGGKKALKSIGDILKKQDIRMGRDRFFKLLKHNGLLVKRRRKLPRTTYSRHAYAVQPNLLKSMEVSGPEQVLVADITYLRVQDSFMYLFLVTDAWSRMVIGWHVSGRLSHEGAKQALKMAVERMDNPAGVIHHSDRGCQYCCHEFLDYLKEHGLRSSMTDANHCAQNALAERMNGILKQEYYLDLPFSSGKTLKKAVANAIMIYNTRRLHWSLNLRTPAEVHRIGQLAA